MARSVAGTFAATGQSGALNGSKIAIHAAFAGTATVSIEWYMNGAWRKIADDGTDLTATFSYVYEGPERSLRLNCTAHTNNVVYEMVTG